MSGLEGLALAASVGAVLEMADRAYRVVFQYLPAVKSARKDAERLISEVRSLCGVLHSLKIFAAALEGEDPGVEKTFRMQHIESCYHLLSKIRSDLEKAEGGFNSSNKLKALHQRLRWPFSEEETTKLLDRVSAHKQTMNLAMTADSVTVLLRKLSRHHDQADGRMANIQSDVRRTLEITRRVEINAKRRDVLDVFSRADTQPAFEASVSKRFPFTGLWLTEGDQFQNWLSTPRSRLWLGGIPGAGKTVLAGAMIEQVLDMSNPSCAVAFFFCDSSNGVVASAIDLLGALAGQLARQSDDAFEILETYYAELRPEQGLPRPPSISRLSQVLAEIIEVFNRVYIIVDGLDEFGDTTVTIIETLIDLWHSTEACSLALLSRDEPHIRDQLEDDFVYIKVEARKEDLEPYVVAKIEEWISHKSKKTKRKISDMTKDAIVKTLVNESDGMFRWVTCQIDYICGEFSTDKERLEALRGLPPTLSKTYERILERINQRGPHIQKLVQRVLRLIFHLGIDAFIPALREAVSTSITNPDDLVTQEEITLRCSSLIRISSDGARFEFAHFTVREFLQNDDLLGSPFEQYHISQRKNALTLALTSVRYLLQPDFSDQKRDATAAAMEALERAKLHPFYPFASYGWSLDADDTFYEDDEVRQAILDLFCRPDKSGNFTNWALELSRQFSHDNKLIEIVSPNYDARKMDFFIGLTARMTRADFTPLHMASVLAIPWLCKHLISEGAGVNRNSRVGTPLHGAIAGPLLFGHGNLDTSIHSWEAFKPYERRLETMKLLLEAGAEPGEVCHSICWSHTPIFVSSRIGMATAFWAPLLELLKGQVPVDSKTYDMLCNFFNNMRNSPYRFEGKGARESLSEAVHGIIDFSADIPEDKAYEITRKLRQTTLEFASSQRTTFPWISSIKLNVGSTENLEQKREQAKLAVRIGDAEAVRKILSEPENQLSSQRFEDGASLLHFSVQSTALHVMETLLDAGFDINLTNELGFTPVMHCSRDFHAPLLRVLASRGANLGAVANEGQTLWHIAAVYNSVTILDLLVELSGDSAMSALAHQDKYGRTPFVVALQNESAATCQCILRHARGEDKDACFASKTPLYRLAVAKTSSPTLLEAMLDAGIPLDVVEEDGETPLHSLGWRNGPHFVSILEKLYPDAGPRKSDGMNPLELLLVRMLSDKSHVLGWETAKVLAKNDNYKVKTLWTFLAGIRRYVKCSGQRPGSKGYCMECKARVSRACLFLMEHGAIEYFEEETGSSALPVFLDYCRNDRGGKWDLLGFDIMQMLVRETEYWETAKQDPRVIDLVIDAVRYDALLVVEFFLDKGVDVCTRGTAPLSIIGQACISGGGCSVETFKCIVAATRAENLNAPDSSGSDETRLLCLVGQDNVKDASAKMDILLKHGADPNTRSADGVPVLCFHLELRSLQNALQLLAAGADPNLQDSDGRNALLVAVKCNLVEFLEAVREREHQLEKPVNWLQTGTDRDGGKPLDGHNALHMAARYSSGYLKCIQFYIDNRFHTAMKPTTDQGRNYLHIAVLWNNTGALRLLGSILDVKTINGRSKAGTTALDIAARRGMAEAVRILLELGAVHEPDPYGITPLLIARVQEHEDVVSILEASLTQARRPRPLSGGESETEDTEKPSATQETRAGPVPDASATAGLRWALQDAIDRGRPVVCRVLRKLGCPFDRPMPECGACSPLLYAILRGEMDIVEWMLGEEGMDINIAEPTCKKCSRPRGVSKNALELVASAPTYVKLLPALMTRHLESGNLTFLGNSSPLGWAAECGNLEAVRAIIKHIRDNISLYRATHAGVLDGCPTVGDVIQTLINLRSSSQRDEPTPLQSAAAFGHFEVVSELIKNKADIDARDVNDRTPLHSAVQYEGDDIALEKTLGSLIDAGANMEYQNEDCQTPLMAAASENNFTAARILVEAGANIHARDHLGQSSLSLTEDGRIFSYLLSKGLDPYEVDHLGIMPVHYALAEVEIRPIILNDPRIRRIPPCPSKNSSRYCWLIRSLSRNLKKISKRRQQLGHSDPFIEFEPEGESFSPLFYAARANSMGAMNSLLDAGADIDFEGSPDGTALMAVCAMGEITPVKLLVRRGASTVYVSKRDGNVKSAVMAAQAFPKVVRWLLVERHTEQPKIMEESVWGSEEPAVSPWSGTWHAKLRLFRGEQLWDVKGHTDFSSFAHRASKKRKTVGDGGRIIPGALLTWTYRGMVVEVGILDGQG